MDPGERRIVLFTSSSHGLVHTFELSIPILLTVWVLEFSTTAATLGVILTIGYGLFGVGALPGGIFVDRFGSKPVIIACLLGMAGSFLLVSAAPSLPVLALAITIWGVTASVYHPAGLALLSKTVDRRGIALGYHGIGGNIGIALGPLAVVLLLIVLDWRLVAVLLTLPAFIVAAYGVTIDVGSELPDRGNDSGGDTKGEISLSNVLSNTRLLLTLGFGLVLLFVTFSGLYYRAFLTFLPGLLGDVLDGLVDVQFIDPAGPYAEEFDPARYLYVMILMVGVFGQYLGGRIADRMPAERGLVLVMAVLASLAVLFVPASGTVWTFVVVSLLLGVALFTVQPLSQAMVAAYSAPEARGLSFGYTYLAIFGVGALGAGLAGVILTVASVRELFVVLAGIAAIGSLLAMAVVTFGVRRD